MLDSIEIYRTMNVLLAAMEHIIQMSGRMALYHVYLVIRMGTLGTRHKRQQSAMTSAVSKLIKANLSNVF